MLYYWESNAPEQLYLKQPVNGRVDKYTWGKVADKVRRVAASILALGLPKESHIAILSKNCAEWFITDLAIMLAGHISVPIYSTAGADTVSYVLDHAKCPLIFVGKLDNTEQQLAAIPEGVKVWAFPYPNINAEKQWQDFIDITPYYEKPMPALDSVMTIIYTSGSTGKPKGVVHSYKSVSWSASSCLAELSLTDQDRILSYLPLAHITERVLVECSSFYSGCQISFVESLDTFSRDVTSIQPTLFISVPRLWTRFQMGVLANLPQKKLNVLLAIPFVGRLISKKIRSKLGLAYARICASGSAPISESTLRWFTKIGVDISEGWGMTENCAYGTACVPFREDKIGSIGRAYKGVDIRIGEEGEIQLKGPCNMKEYYLEPEKTAEVFTDDGYLRTGDKGSIDCDGYIKITGRLKEIFKTAKGKYIAPVPIEAKLMGNSLIEQVCVTGAELKQPIALVVLSGDAKKQSQKEVEQSLLRTLDSVNDGLESHEMLDRLVLMQDEWTVDNGLLTPTLKVKRHALEQTYHCFINGTFEGKIARQ